MHDKFKNFVLSIVTEESDGVGMYNASPTHGWIGKNEPELDMNDLFNVHRKDILDRLNQFVESINARTYINPGTAIARLRDKLTMVGLSIPVMPVKEGLDRLPVMQFGGIFNPYTGKTEDKIAEQLGHGFDLALRVTKCGVRYSVAARIISSNDESPYTERSETQK